MHLEHNRTQQNTALDGLRGFAALLVLLVHFHTAFVSFVSQSPALAWTSEILGGFGRAGVGIFYALTGYLIFAQLMIKDQPYFKFVWRRIIRIYPVFFAVFCCYLVLFVMFPQVNKLKGLNPGDAALVIVQNLLLLPGVFKLPQLITVAWTLSFIMAFYLIAPLYVKVFRLRRLKKRPVLFLLVAAWLAYAACCAWLNFSPRPLMFITGMILYQVADSRLVMAPGKVWESVSFLGVLLTLTFAWLFHAHRAWLFLPVEPNLLRQLIISAGMVPFFMYCIYHYGLVHRVMSNLVFVKLGKLSYSWYLVQGLTLHASLLLVSKLGVKQVGAPGFIGLLLGAVLANWLGAIILHHLVEKPFSIDRKQTRQVDDAPASSSQKAFGAGA
jgi:exopolysaccharide production protein ExoZ